MVKKNSLKIAVACGGTGGHIFPGLATANILKSRGHHVTLWLAGKDGEKKAVEQWNGDLISIESEGFQYGFSFKSFKTILKIVVATIKTFLEMKNRSPDVLLAMGSYASIAPVLSCQLLKKPYILHEANVVPGRAVSFLSSKAECVALSFKETEKYLNTKKCEHTGMPLRNVLYEKSKDHSHKEKDSKFTILITGGSRGATSINQKIIDALKNDKFKSLDFKIIHIIGNHSIDKYYDFYNENNIHAEVYKFVHNIEDYFSTADFVISRSGASTCFELCIFGKPSLLIPYPFAVRDHQLKNAMVLHKYGAADVISEKNLSKIFLENYLIDIISHPKKVTKKSDNAKKLYQQNAANELADLVEKCVRL